MQRQKPYIQAKTTTNLTLKHSCQESSSLVEDQSFHQFSFHSSLPPTSSSPKIVTQTLITNSNNRSFSGNGQKENNGEEERIDRFLKKIGDFWKWGRMVGR